MATIGFSELFCLVCSSNIDKSSCINIYFTSLPPNGDTLASFVFRVLRSESFDFRSSYICLQCYNLFQMLEQAQSNVTNICCEILKAYQFGEKRKLIKETANVSVETAFIEKSLVSDFAQEEKLEISNALCHIQNTCNLRPEFSKVRLDETKTYIDVAFIENNLESLNVDLSLFDKSRTNPKSETTNTTVPGNLSNISNDVRDNYLKLKKFGEINKVTLDENFFNSFRTSISSSIPQQTFTEAVKDERVPKSNENDHLNRQDKTSTFTEYAQCKLCNRLFRSAKSFELHLLKHGGCRPYHCEKCKDRFADLNLANVHFVEMHPKEKYCIGLASKPCENEVIDFLDIDGILAEDLFTEMDNRNAFILNHALDDKSHPSDDKKNKLDQNSLNRNTLRSSTEASEKTCKSRRVSKYSQTHFKHKCSTCDKKWRTLAELKTHMTSHSNLRPFMCEKCGQVYKHKTALEVHIGMHNGINPFQCSFCNKCFTQKGSLMRHLPIHTGETPFQCELCGKRFVHHTSYHMHALSHTGEKSYRCDVCDLALLSTSHLKRHMRVHTGEKLYSCNSCGKRFAERYNLFVHKKIHDPLDISSNEAKKILYQCKQCDDLFYKKKNFEEHVRENHNSATEVSNS